MVLLLLLGGALWAEEMISKQKLCPQKGIKKTIAWFQSRDCDDALRGRDFQMAVRK